MLSNMAPLHVAGLKLKERTLSGVQGAIAVAYRIMVAIAVVIIGAVSALGGNLNRRGESSFAALRGSARRRGRRTRQTDYCSSPGPPMLTLLSLDSRNRVGGPHSRIDGRNRAAATVPSARKHRSSCPASPASREAPTIAEELRRLRAASCAAP